MNYLKLTHFGKSFCILCLLVLLGSCHMSTKQGNTSTDRGIQYETYPSAGVDADYPPEHNTEAYNVINENEFVAVESTPLSTFSIDVDAASYSNTRRFLMRQNMLPPKDAVRIEEFINYFKYDYPQPDEHPFSITTEIGPCPWNEKHQLVHIGLQGEEMDFRQLPANNLVFLLDVSGSMDSYDKLPLLKQAFRMLIDQMRPQDRVAVVVYAGAAGLVLPSTSFSEKSKILEAIDDLDAGGSTAGGKGINLAYKVAKDNFIEGGNNRVILATDGDFNVGASSDAEMVRLIEEKRESGIFLTVLGFGTGNYKDSKMEQLADKGNGNYAYIDNVREAKKVLVNEIGSTLFTIAKDVKIQVEFNPSKVKGYRLIGYENRLLNNKDFDDDAKDAGELGAGHSVTALYELIPAGSDEVVKTDVLKYQLTTIMPSALASNEWMTVKFRYKPPKSDSSILIEHPVAEESVGKISGNFTFSASVAAFGMLLRDSQFKGDANYELVKAMAKTGSRADDEQGYRAEFVQMVETAEILAKR